MRKKFLLILGLLVVCVTVSGVVMAASSPNHDLPVDALSGGGGERSSTNYALLDISGQSTVMGASGSPGYQLHAGFIPSVHNPSGGADTATVRLDVALQGSSRPEGGWEIPITITIGGTPYEPISTGITGSGENKKASYWIDGITPGTYHITIDSATTLRNERQNVPLVAGASIVDMGTLLEGDANGDDIINISDFGILAVAFMSTSIDANWDERADFDRNGIINISDFGLLAVNFMKTSPVTVP